MRLAVPLHLLSPSRLGWQLTDSATLSIATIEAVDFAATSGITYHGGHFATPRRPKSPCLLVAMSIDMKDQRGLQGFGVCDAPKAGRNGCLRD